MHERNSRPIRECSSAITDQLCQGENCVSVAGLLYHPNDQHALAVIDDPKL